MISGWIMEMGMGWRTSPEQQKGYELFRATCGNPNCSNMIWQLDADHPWFCSKACEDAARLPAPMGDEKPGQPHLCVQCQQDCDCLGYHMMTDCSGCSRHTR